MSGIALILALIALIAAFGARRSATALQARLAAVLDELQALRTQVAALRLAFPEAPRAEAAPSSETAPAPPPPAEAESPAAAPVEPPQTDAPIPTATPEPTVTPAQPAEPVPAALPAPAAPAGPSLEEQLGTRWAVWLGGLALAMGGVLLVRYSIEQGLFGPEVRVALGAAFALVLIAAGEWFRRSERASPVEGIPSAHIPGILTAAGTISAFGTVYAAHALYSFIGPATAFVLLGAIGVATMLAAALHGPALAGLGLAGAFAVPLLVTSQQPSPWPVVLYLATVAASAYALARLRRWLWLACAAVAGAMAWGFALLDPVSSGAAGPWALALVVHVGVQLALAAAFIAIEPHLTTADADAEPDWIATLALAALALLVDPRAPRPDAARAVARLRRRGARRPGRDGMAERPGRRRRRAGRHRGPGGGHPLAWSRSAARAAPAGVGADAARVAPPAADAGGHAAAPARQRHGLPHLRRPLDAGARRSRHAAALAQPHLADGDRRPLHAGRRGAAAAGAGARLPARYPIRPLDPVRAHRRRSGGDLLRRRRPASTGARPATPGRPP